MGVHQLKLLLMSQGKRKKKEERDFSVLLHSFKQQWIHFVIIPRAAGGNSAAHSMHGAAQLRLHPQLQEIV